VERSLVACTHPTPRSSISVLHCQPVTRLEIQHACIEVRCELKNRRSEPLAAAAHVQRERVLRVALAEAELSVDIRAIDREERSIDRIYRREGSGVGTADPADCPRQLLTLASHPLFEWYPLPHNLHEWAGEPLVPETKPCPVSARAGSDRSTATRSLDM
jgi:hypothetical protein